MYLLFAIGFSSKGFRVFSSKSVTSKIADGGAKIVPNGVSCISLKIIHQILKCYFSVLLQQVPQLCHLSLVWYPFIMVLTKNLSCLGLPHALPYPRVVYMLRANNALCPKQIQQSHCQDLSQEFWGYLSNCTIDFAFSEYDYFIFQKKSQCPIIFQTAQILLRYCQHSYSLD